MRCYASDMDNYETQQLADPVSHIEDSLSASPFWKRYLVVLLYSWLFAPLILIAGIDGGGSFSGPGVYLLTPFVWLFTIAHPIFIVLETLGILLFAIYWTVLLSRSSKYKISGYRGIYLILGYLAYVILNSALYYFFLIIGLIDRSYP